MNDKTDKVILGRLTHQAAFDSLRKTKTRWVSKGFAVQAAPPDAPYPFSIGYCVITSKKTASKAVERNKMRRRLRAVIHDILSDTAKNNMNYMIVARKGASTLPMDDLKRDMVWCLKRLELLRS